AVLAELPFEEFFHPEWSTAWDIEGFLDSRHAEVLAGDEAEPAAFGTQRFRAWIEVFTEANPLVPAARYRSLGAEDLPEKSAEMATITAALEGPAGPASAVFGLIGLALPEEPPPDLVADFARLAENRLAFSRVSVLREVLAAAGARLDTLAWTKIELNGSVAWESAARQGDLLRVGARVVVLHQDRDGDGALGGEDTCLDFEERAAIRRLVDVFPGEGEIEWASLTI
ncbi:MAG: hypothetical protein R3190_18665, partial [Thermoanaerobaculia bacterium]|nr:hypothetical protein [Thermoanaerobaculia bacterium]